MSDVVEGDVAEPPRDLRAEYVRLLRKCTTKQRAWLRLVRQMVPRQTAITQLGYSTHTLYKWLRNDRIRAAMALQQEMAMLDSDITYARLEREYERIAFAQLLDFRAPNGALLPFAQWTPEMGAAVTEVEFNLDGSVKRFKLHRKAPAQDTLSRVKGYLVDRRELTGPDGQPLQAAPPIIQIVRYDDDAEGTAKSA